MRPFRGHEDDFLGFKASFEEAYVQKSCPLQRAKFTEPMSLPWGEAYATVEGFICEDGALKAAVDLLVS